MEKRINHYKYFDDMEGISNVRISINKGRARGLSENYYAIISFPSETPLVNNHFINGVLRKVAEIGSILSQFDLKNGELSSVWSEIKSRVDNDIVYVLSSTRDRSFTKIGRCAVGPYYRVPYSPNQKAFMGQSRGSMCMNNVIIPILMSCSDLEGAIHKELEYYRIKGRYLGNRRGAGARGRFECFDLFGRSYIRKIFGAPCLSMKFGSNSDLKIFQSLHARRELGNLYCAQMPVVCSVSVGDDLYIMSYGEAQVVRDLASNRIYPYERRLHGKSQALLKDFEIKESSLKYQATHSDSCMTCNKNSCRGDSVACVDFETGRTIVHNIEIPNRSVNIYAIDAGLIYLEAPEWVYGNRDWLSKGEYYSGAPYSNLIPISDYCEYAVLGINLLYADKLTRAAAGGWEVVDQRVSETLIFKPPQLKLYA